MRHEARRVAFCVLFGSEFRSEDFAAGLEEELERYQVVHGRLPGDVQRFARHLIEGVLREQSRVDEEITGAGSNWDLRRIGRVEKSILRLAIQELLRPDDAGELLPVEIVIDEAIELAKIYGSDETPGFINGVLDAVAAKVRSLSPPSGAEG